MWRMVRSGFSSKRSRKSTGSMPADADPRDGAPRPSSLQTSKSALGQLEAAASATCGVLDDGTLLHGLSDEVRGELHLRVRTFPFGVWRQHEFLLRRGWTELLILPSRARPSTCRPPRFALFGGARQRAAKATARLPLSGCAVQPVALTSRVHTFVIAAPKRSLVLAAPSQEALFMWVRALSDEAFIAPTLRAAAFGIASESCKTGETRSASLAEGSAARSMRRSSRASSFAFTSLFLPRKKPAGPETTPRPSSRSYSALEEAESISTIGPSRPANGTVTNGSAHLHPDGMPVAAEGETPAGRGGEEDDAPSLAACSDVVTFATHKLSRNGSAYRFATLKLNRAGIRKPRTLEVDVSSNTLSQLMPDGTVKFTAGIRELARLERMDLYDACQAHIVRISLRNGRHRLFDFGSANERERFLTRIEEMSSSVRMDAVGGGKKPLTVRVCSWNMGDRPAPADLAPWLGASPECDGATIVAVGTQESGEDLSAAVAAHLGEPYVLLNSTSLVGLRLYLFARKSATLALSRVQTASKATGLGNLYGNKGAVACSLHYHNSSICFVNAHLAARPERVADRNANAGDIIAGLGLGRRGLELTDQFDYTFFFGDLNYRVQTSFDDAAPLYYAAAAVAATVPLALSEGGDALGEQTEEAPASEQTAAVESLLLHDQLRAEMSAGRVLHGYEEAAIGFAPTYRLEVGSDPPRPRTLSNKRGQAPSYTDRVLYRALPGRKATPLAYRSAPEIDTSDHAPVAALFDLEPRLPTLHLGGFTLSVRLEDVALKGYQPPRVASSLRHGSLLGGGALLPTLSFYSSVLDCGGVSIATGGATLGNGSRSFCWSAEDTPLMRTFATSLPQLNKHHLLVALRSRGALLGQGAIALSDASSSRPAPFRVALLRQGIRVGELTGTLILTDEYGEPIPPGSIERLLSRKSQLHRMGSSRDIGLIGNRRRRQSSKSGASAMAHAQASSISVVASQM